MQDDIPKIDQKPAILWRTFDPASQLVLLSNAFDRRIRQRADHAVAGAGADDKIICEVRDIMNIEQKDIFSLFLFKCIDNASSKF